MLLVTNGHVARRIGHQDPDHLCVLHSPQEVHVAKLLFVVIVFIVIRTDQSRKSLAVLTHGSWVAEALLFGIVARAQILTPSLIVAVGVVLAIVLVLAILSRIGSLTFADILNDNTVP